MNGCCYYDKYYLIKNKLFEFFDLNTIISTIILFYNTRKLDKNFIKRAICMFI